MNFNSINTLGVINRTPNSFSCQGESLRDEALFHKLQAHQKSSRIVSDIGFESTAPMNSAISAEEEILRFREYLNKTKSYDFADRFLSLDTYRPENFLLMARELRRYHPRIKFIFNDVSGVLDSSLKEVLKACKEQFRNNDFYYIYNSTHIPDRTVVLMHDKFIKRELPIVDQCVDAFSRAHSFFKELKMDSQLILDPGFGFSKTYDQNWDLIYNFNTLIKKLETLNIHNAILIGLSKKRFLKTKLLVQDASMTESLHRELIIRLSSITHRQLIFRVHDTSITQGI